MGGMLAFVSMRRSHRLILGLGVVASAATLTLFGSLFGPSPRAVWDRIAFAEERPGRVDFEAVGRGFDQATDIQFVPGAPATAIVLQKTGAARVLVLPKPGEQRVTEAKQSRVLFRVEVRDRSELGLLGL